MADRGSLVLIRIVTVVIALLAAAAIVISAGAIAYSKPQGFGLEDVLVAPIVFAFYAGPPLFVVAMALRSRSMVAALIPLVVAGFFVGALLVFGLVPEKLVFAFWPLAALGGLAWLPLNRRAAPS